MFSLVGLLLAIYGGATGSDTELYKRSLGININLIWGVVLVVFGAFMLVSWKVGQSADAAKPPESAPKK
ncbi:MAG: hypothetical protein HZA90_16720 [Verrucomicrobia bacterium]|nr:hypothetical protein [Verrucomicrobiota bacterium]